MKKKNNKIEVKEVPLWRTNTTIEPQASNPKKFNLNDYFKLKTHGMDNLKQVAASGDGRYLTKSEILELIRQEIDVLTLPLDNQQRQIT